MSRWRGFWRALDEARFSVRVMVLAKFVGLVGYIYLVTDKFFDVIETANAANGDAQWTNLAAVLGAVTAFASITIPVLSSMYLKAWADYRGSGTDWHAIENGQDRVPRE